MSGRGWLLAALLVVIVGGLVLAVPRLEGEPPEIAEIPELAVGTEPLDLEIDVADAGAGLRRVEVRLHHAGGGKALFERGFRGGFMEGGAPGAERHRIALRLDPRELGLPDGPARLVVTARDWSWRSMLSGNRAEREVSLRIDTTAPRVSVESGLTYVNRGGSAAVVYRVAEDAERHGVEVGEAFFPGFPLAESSGDGRMVAFFAIPVEAPQRPSVRVVASDRANNRGTAPFPAQVLERRFAESRVNLPRRFLDEVVPSLAQTAGIDAADPSAAFSEINSVLRKRNEDRIREIVAGSGSQRLWQGSFAQQPNSKVTSRFAESRAYVVDGSPVSHARHYGFDLASTQAAAITASNAGRVLFAGELGIYGNCVVVDHGQGITSLYAHMSRLDVSEGDAVDKGQTVGLSGATGLAGGDHLHFAILVGGTYVDPLEWWDPKWVRSHVEVRLAPSGS